MEYEEEEEKKKKGETIEIKQIFVGLKLSKEVL
jgi:hypothetical protein